MSSSSAPGGQLSVGPLVRKTGPGLPGAAFKIDGQVHASEREGLILAASNPLDATHMVLVVAGNDTLSTVKSQREDLPRDEHMIFKDGDPPLKGFIHRDSSAAQSGGRGHPYNVATVSDHK